ncbi:hypothetical protein OL239_17600 [Arthrobacter sp. ATA002]|uniref:hypothetical protein n=1 Tax=Arthrobacter sp. ATA002 TaxID=2991715 RepID=UPI0022A6F2A8|nr:hypothetical protein [Arthrobacter sp. ATA002]WAP51568.1 hypothetical protein OL239_17600 [Arthrobacter sp. ATA002]
MSASIDLSGTARLPAAPELLKAAAALRKHTSDAGETMQLAHSAWSFLAGAYTAPEQQQVHRAMDRPRHDGQALAAAGSRAAEALETFAAAVEGIRRQCLELQDDMEQLQEREQPVAGGGVQPAGMVTP